MHVCPVNGCQKQLPRSKLLCWPHWSQVPPRLKHAVWDLWENAPGTPAYMEARQAAIDAVNAKAAQPS